MISETRIMQAAGLKRTALVRGYWSRDRGQEDVATARHPRPYNPPTFRLFPTHSKLAVKDGFG